MNPPSPSPRPPRPLLVELLSEEIPALQQATAAEQLAENLGNALKQAHIKFDADRKKHLSSPRRIAVLFEEVSATADTRNEEIKGPKLSAPEQAVHGFLKKYNLPNADVLEVRDAGGEPTYFYKTQQQGGNTADLLPDIIVQTIQAQKWKKSMRFGNQDFTWTRPLKNILVMLGDEIIKGELPLGTSQILEFNDGSFGHARLTLPPANEKIIFKTAKDYEKTLEEKSVIACAKKRKGMIENELQNYNWGNDEKLLDEVNGLVEYPYFTIGTIEQQFMALPDEVLITSLRSHQKYFCLYDKVGKLESKFAFVANLPINDDIINGNERVLRARLADAMFLFDEDKKIPLADRIADLKTMNYFHGLGTMADKVERLEKLAESIAPYFNSDKDKAKKTARLLKADLMTEMVGEFPELQGIMGAEYAEHEGYDDDIVFAIRRHYQEGEEIERRGEGLSQSMALIDKIDHLSGFWLIGKQPSGSKDPFALRRAALGIVRIINSSDIQLNLHDIFFVALKIYDEKADKKTADELVLFCLDRYRTSCAEQGIAYDILDAIFQHSSDGNLLELRTKIEVLQEFLKTDESKDAVATIKRIANILKTEPSPLMGDSPQKTDKNKKEKPPAGQKSVLLDALASGKTNGAATQVANGTATQVANGSATHAIEESLLTEPAERQLWQKYNEFFKSKADKNNDYSKQLQQLAKLRSFVDSFFDSVMVNDDDKKIRQNRLNLLKVILSEADKVADFSKLVER